MTNLQYLLRVIIFGNQLQLLRCYQKEEFSYILIYIYENALTFKAGLFSFSFFY